MGWRSHDLRQPGTSCAIRVNAINSNTGRIMRQEKVKMTGTGYEATTLVHTIETTVPKRPLSTKKSSHVPMPSSFHERCRLMDTAEYEKAEWLYGWLTDLGEKDQTANLAECRNRAWFVRNRHTNAVRVVSNQCRLRWCPLCQRAKAKFMSRSISDWLRTLDRPKFLTLTLKHSDAPLQFQIAELYRFFQRFRKLRDIRKQIRGGVWFFQIHRSTKTNQWHPHLHCLLDSDFIPHEELSRLWLRTTLSSSVVDIRQVKELDKAAEYVSRDAAKPARLEGIEPDQMIELFYALKGKRICGTWGTAKKLQLTAKPLSDKTDWVDVGSWSVVVGLRNEHPAAEAIIKAWLTKKPLQPGLSLSEFDNFIDDGIQAAARTAKQKYLEFY